MLQLKIKDLKAQHKELVGAVKMAEDALAQVSNISQMMDAMKEVRWSTEGDIPRSCVTLETLSLAYDVFRNMRSWQLDWTEPGAQSWRR